MSFREKSILRVLQKHPDGLTTIDVARKADMSKTTAIKYLATFRMAGKADFIEVGPSKLWRLVAPKKRGERRIIIPRRKKLDAIMEEFKEEADLVGTAIVDNQGLTLSAMLPDNIDPERLGALTAILFRAGIRSIDIAKLDEFRQIIVEGSQGRIVAYNEGKVLLIAFCGLDTMLGTIRLEMEDFSRKINEILS